MNNQNNNGNRIKSQEIKYGDNYVLPLESTKVTACQSKVKQLLDDANERANQIVNNAENKSQIIVQTANTEAENIIGEGRKKAQNEYDAIKEQAYKEGFAKGEQDGFNKFQQDASEALKSLETLASSSFQLKKNILDSASRDIVELVIAIADKVCHITFKEKILHDITLDAIKKLNDKENITIIVNPHLMKSLENILPSIKQEVSQLGSVKITEDNSVSPDGVIVETPNTRLDSRVSVQIAEIAEKMLMGADDGMEQE